jgi:subtilisin family serine protease
MSDVSHGEAIILRIDRDKQLVQGELSAMKRLLYPLACIAVLLFLLRPQHVVLQMGSEPGMAVQGQLEPQQDSTISTDAQDSVYAKNNFATELTDLNHIYQLKQEKRRAYEHTLSLEESADYANWMSGLERDAGRAVRARAELEGISAMGTDAEGRGYTLIGYEGMHPVFMSTVNREAAISIATHLVRRNAAFDPVHGADLDGRGLYVNINDHGTIYAHPEFSKPLTGESRIVLAEVNDGGQRNHMTHVAGTLAAHGYTTAAQGMAPGVWIRALIQQKDSDVLNYGMKFPGQSERSVIGNTSLAEINPACRGQYNTLSASFDQVLWDHPYYLHFYAASNGGPGYATLTRNGNIAKNVITVGSVNDVQRTVSGHYLGGGLIASGSSRGPTKDGRIKPDIVANGEGVYSTFDLTSYGVSSGTSMATPSAAGSAVLLVDYFNRRFPGQFMRAATTKALILNTTEDLGAAGPDYIYGWGLMNTKSAVELLKHYADQPDSRVLVEDRLLPEQVISIPYNYNGTGPIRVTLVWHDLPGEPAVNCDPTPTLVNNLHLRINGPDGEHLPFVMPFTIGHNGIPAFSTQLYSAEAVRGINNTDNINQVIIEMPADGEYLVEVYHSGSLTGPEQHFSLVLSGLSHADPDYPFQITSHPQIGDYTDFYEFEVTGTGFMLGAELRLERENFTPVSAYAIEVSADRMFSRMDTAELESGLWDVVVVNPDGREQRVPGGFFLPNDYEDWISQFDGLTEEEQSSMASPAGDGVSNLLKYAFGMNPLSTQREGLPQVRAVTIEDETYLTLTYRRLLRGISEGIGGYKMYRLSYAVEVSYDLLTWQTSDTYGDELVRLYSPTWHEPQNLETETLSVRTRDPVPESGQSIFIRLKVAYDE